MESASLQRYRDRTDAGRRLAEHLREYAGRDDVVVLGAIATGGARVLDTALIESLGLPAEWIEAIDAKDRRERTSEWEAGELPDTYPFGV